MCGVGLVVFRYCTERKPELYSGESLFFDGFRTDGPFVVRDSHKPTLLFSVWEWESCGYDRSVPYVIVIEHSEDSEFSFSADNFLYQPPIIASTCDLEFGGCDLHVAYDVMPWEDSGAMNQYDESIQFFDSINGYREFDLSIGRVFSVRFDDGNAQIEQLDYGISGLEDEICDDERKTVRNVYAYWDRLVSPDNK